MRAASACANRLNRIIGVVKMKFLLIDDETEICFLIRKVLERIGIHCDMAHSLAHGREHLGRGTYHAVFLDVHLPDGKGYELVPEIRQSQPGAHVIAMSAVDNERAHAEGSGVDYFLPKPFDKSSILGGLRALRIIA